MASFEAWAVTFLLYGIIALRIVLRLNSIAGGSILAAPRKPSCSPLPITELMAQLELLAGRGVTDDVLAHFYAGFLVKLYADGCQDLALYNLQLLITVGEIELVELITTHLNEKQCRHSHQIFW